VKQEEESERKNNRKNVKMTEAMIRKKPGMASVKDMPLLQDGPPPGGFAPARFARRIPNTGPSALAIFLTTFGAFSWGMYQVGQGNKIRRYFLFLIFYFRFSFYKLYFIIRVQIELLIEC
jgi:NADH dehydrogenase (ubiquinone) 1 alpha subcomplex subunit 13